MPATSNAKTLKIPRSDAVALLVSLQFKTAPSWDTPKIARFFAALAERAEADDIDDDDLKQLYADVAGANATGNPVEIEDDSPPVKPGPKPGAKKRPAIDYKKEAKQAAHSRKRPGVCDYVMRVLERASEKKPLTKEQVFEKLKAKFPNRLEEGMRNTVKRLKNWIPFYFDAVVHQNAGGFWLTRDYEGEFRRIKSSSKKE